MGGAFAFASPGSTNEIRCQAVLSGLLTSLFINSGSKSSNSLHSLRLYFIFVSCQKGK